jgi:hypothetical protein
MVTLSHAFWKHEMIRAMDIDVLETQRSNPFHILSSSFLPVIPQFIQNILHIPGVPQNDHIDDQPKRAQLILLPLAIALTKLTTLPVKYMTGQAMPVLSTVELRLNASAILFVVNIVE